MSSELLDESGRGDAEKEAEEEEGRENKIEIPKKWKWIESILKTEKRLKEMGYLVKFDGDERIVYDPKRRGSSRGKKRNIGEKVTYNIDTLEKTIHKSDPIRFIKEGKTAKVRSDRLEEFRQRGMFTENWTKKELVPCMAHGDFVYVEALEADHAEAKSTIRDRQMDLVKQINENEKLKNLIKKMPGMDKFFAKAKIPPDKKAYYYGTLLFYELYFNDIDNIWLICNVCNKKKSNNEVIKWLKNAFIYGEEFIDYIERVRIKDEKKHQEILMKIGDQQGLAEALIEWYWENKANFILLSKELLEKVDTPIKILGREIDSLEDEEEAENAQASLDFRVAYMAEIATMEGVTPATHHQREQIEAGEIEEKKFLHDKDKNLVEATAEEYNEARSDAIQESIINVPNIISSKIKEKKRKRNIEETEEKEEEKEVKSGSSSAENSGDEKEVAKRAKF